MSNTTAARTATYQALDFTLENLPPRDPFATYTHATMCAYLDERHAACLRIAGNTLDLAATINANGDAAAARELIDEATRYLTEAASIRARRI